jgi:DNA-binding beta-propeller fold protein YncE
MKRLTLFIVFGLLTASLALVRADVPQYDVLVNTVNVAPSTPQLTAVDPMVYAVSTDVVPARPFLYSVDKNGITITRFNDNKVVGTWPWPKDVIYTVTPDGGYVGLTPPAQWEPVAMTVSYPTETEFANRGMTGTTVLKPIPDLTPPFTFVYVVMAHSGYAWQSVSGTHRDTIVANADPATDSSMLIQIDVSDPSFSAAADPANPVFPHIAAALLGHGAGQPVYNRATGSIYVGNMPSDSLPSSLASFVSVIGRIPDTVAEVEAEVPGISIPVIRCGPQHPESGIPVGRPQAYACYDPSGVHPINDNEHVGAYGNFTWEFRNLPDWLTAHADKATGQLDGILYGTPPATGEWYAEARVHNLDDPYGVFSFWTPVQLLVTPTAEYLPVKVQFAAGVPVAYPLEGTGNCAVTGAPSWVDVQTVPNGCIVMGRAPLDGEHYDFTMPGFTVAGYPSLSLVFSGNVFGEYGFIPLPDNVGLSGLAWHQVSKVADPSTETPVLSLEYIGVEPSTGQLYHILAPPGTAQPPNERPPETVLTLDVVSTLGSPLLADLTAARPDIAGHLVGFGEVAVEADRDIFVAAVTDSTIADGALVKVSGGTPSIISLPGVQAHHLDLDSDLRTAIPGVEPGQVDHGSLLVTGTTSGNVAVIDTTLGTVAQTLAVGGATSLGSVSVDFGTRYAYVAAGSLQSIAYFSAGTARPPMAPRIWSAEEFTWNLGQAGTVHMMATGHAVPALSLLGTPPPGLSFVDNGDGTATISGTPTAAGGGGVPGGELDVEGGDYAMALRATSATGTYAQAFGITVQSPPEITSPNTATFVAGSANSFTVTGRGWPTPIFYIWDVSPLPPGVQLIDNENGTSSLIGTPEAAGTYVFRIYATSGCPPDAEQEFTLIVEPAAAKAPVITSDDTFTWDAAGAPYSPDPFTVTSIGSPTPALSVSGTLPPGVTFIDNGDSTATLGGACRVVWPGWPAECLGFLPDTAVGTWTFTITAANSAGSATQTFTLNVGRDASLLGAAPATLSFLTDGTFVPVQAVALTTGGGVLPYALVTTANWLSATPVSGMMPGNINVSANAAGLAPGTYTGTVIVNSAGTEGPPATVAVTLTVVPVAPAGTVRLWPNTLRFDYQLKGALPPAQTVWVMSGGARMSYKVSTAGAKWLSAPASGTAPGGFRVSVDPRVGVGMHVGTLTITGAGAVNGPQSIPVTLVKTAGDKDLIQVMFDVGGSPEGLALNQKTHHLFITSSNAAAEAGGEAGGSGAEVEVPGPPEPSSVFQIDPVDQTVVGQTVVHSEGEYIGVNSKTGRAYHASQGTGEVAVIDGAKNKVLAFIPLTLNGGVYQPYQVAIDEAQNLIYVGAKAPPIPDPPHSSPFPCKAIHEIPDDEYDCWNPGSVFVIDGQTNKIVSSFKAGDDPEGVVFAAATRKVYASNEDDGSITVAKGAVRNANGTITPPAVLGTIIHGLRKAGWWQPTCDSNNYCGERGQADLWPKDSACHGLDDEAEEADKMAVDPDGNVYIIDDRYRVAKIDGATDKVVDVLEIPGYDCELDAPDGSEVLFRNTANNIAFMAHGKGTLYVTSEQNTVSLIDPAKMKVKATITVPEAGELDAITTDPALKRVYITDEALAALWILKGACANGTGKACVQ